MDGTRLGITFEEAQTVLRNIRERNLEKFNQGYSQPFGKGHNKGGDVLLNRGCSSSSSPYFKTAFRHKRDNHDPHRRILPNQNLRSEQRTEETSHSGLSLQPFVPKTCSITKRLQSLKESRVRERQGSSSYQASSVKQPVLSNLDAKECKQSSSTSESVQSDYCNGNLKRERNIQDSKTSTPPVKSKKLSTDSNMNITSYLPKVKHPRTTRPLNKTTTAKIQTKIHDFGLPAPQPKKTNTVSMESMSKEERESLRTKIFSATNIACTLVYTTGNTLVRPNSAKNSVKGIYIAFPKEDQQLSDKNTFNIENCHCVFVPVSVFEKEWSRGFVISLMEADNNKIIYDAQKFIKALIPLLTIEDHSACFRWQCFDPKIAAWLLDPDHPPEDFDALLLTELGKDNVLASQGKADSSEVKKINKDNNSNDQLYHDMFSLLSLMPRMFLSLQNKNLWELFSEVEMKICPILAVMEFLGVEIDTQLLFSYGNILQKKSQKLEQEGFKIVGHPFQMSSTQQLRQILFNELQLDKSVNKKLARTQIKNYKSTAENVLKHLQDYHPLPKIVLEYRHVSKLKSAYVDGILSFVENGTLHTNWNQTSTATGRLTSTNPNIQAIPRNQLDITGVTEQFIIGKEMETFSIVPRQAFKSRAGWTFLSADFQSIELRLLAHFSEDPLLLQIFNRSEDDIFIQLASLWLSLDPKSIQSEQRERAKRVVYSVIYGVGKERLAETLGVSAEEAKTFTNSFLATFPGLKKFIQDCVNRCRSQGYVTTIFGRQRLLPAINSNELHLRSQSERQAVNFVIQGSAADICKMGMILVVRSLTEKFKLDARLLIQIHDELVLEVRDCHMQDIKELVKSCLEDTKALCAGHVRLKVNFKVSLSCGKTWADMQLLK